MLRRVVLVRTDVSEELSASILRMVSFPLAFLPVIIIIIIIIIIINDG
jgi:hypothetical protein